MNKVCGLLFSPDFSEVVLISKEGQLSGIEGPADKEDRRVRDTMSRVCKEQTELEIRPDDWTMFAEFLKPDKTDGERIVYFFHNTHAHKEAKGEGVGAWPVDDRDGQLTLPARLRWLIPLAASWGEQDLDIVLMYDKSCRSRRK